MATGENPPQSSWWRELALHGIALVGCLLLLSWIYPFQHLDLNTPVFYSDQGDGLYYNLQAKVLLETGWFYRQPDLGGGVGLDMYDFPQFEALHLLVFKVLGLIRPHWGAVINLFYFLTFVFVTHTSLFLFRYLRIPAIPAVALALLYAFQPYHLMRNQGHLMLSAYYHVPLLVLVAVWLLERRGLAAPDGVTYRTSGRFWFALVVSAASCFGGHYYLCFGLFFYLLAALFSAFRDQRIAPVVQLGVLVAVCGVCFVGNLIPNIRYWAEHGSNKGPSQKSPYGSELYGLKLIQMILPCPDHRIGALARMSQRYEQSIPNLNESTTARIGLLGSIGFFTLLGASLLLASRREEELGLRSLGIFATGGLLLAGVGGGLTIFAYFVHPQLHAPNRMSIFLALFGLIAIGWFVLAASNRIATPGRRLLFQVVAGMLLLGIGIFDQVPERMRVDPRVARNLMEIDAAFGRAIQEQQPTGAKLFMLPADDFPLPAMRFENGTPVMVLVSDHIRAYLHTDGMRWSDPCMVNRRAHRWNHLVASLPAGEMLETLAVAGYSGVLVDTRGKHPREAALLAYFRSHLGEGITDGGSRTFFDLRGFASGLKSKLSEEEWDRRSWKASVPVQVIWRTSFFPVDECESDLERHPDRWASGSWASIVFDNTTNRTLRTRISFTLHGTPATRSVTVDGKILGEETVEGSGSRRIERIVELAPGRHPIRLSARGAAVPISPTRTGWFRVEGLRVETLSGARDERVATKQGD